MWLQDENPSNLDKELAQKNIEIANLREALSFYANEDNWKKIQILPHWKLRKVDGDEGDLAREALDSTVGK